MRAALDTEGYANFFLSAENGVIKFEAKGDTIHLDNWIMYPLRYILDEVINDIYSDIATWMNRSEVIVFVFTRGAILAQNNVTLITLEVLLEWLEIQEVV